MGGCVLMSDFVEALVDLLPEHNSLKDTSNDLRTVLDKSLGAWFDNYDVQTLYDNLFLNSSTGEYLDLHGRDYGVYRQSGESDDSYRERIIQEKNDRLTPEYLQSLYGLSLYVYVASFDATDNTLTSDNPYINSTNYMAVADTSIQNMLNSKFILDGGLTWL